MPATAPRPEDPRPLNERERRELEAIGREIAAESPRLGTELARGPAWRAVDDGLALLSVLVILAVLLPGPWFGWVLLVTVMAGPALVALHFRSR